MIKSDEVTRFRNTTNFSGREVTDFNKATVKPALIKLTIALDVLFVAIGLFMYFELNSLIAGVILGCMAIIFPLIMPYAYKKTISKNAQENPFCSSNTFLDYRFVDDGVYVRTLKGDVEISSATIDYRWIIKVKEHTHYFYIFISGSLCYILDTLGMTEGKPEELKAFLIEKGIPFKGERKKIGLNRAIEEENAKETSEQQKKETEENKTGVTKENKSGVKKENKTGAIKENKNGIKKEDKNGAKKGNKNVDDGQ